MKTAVRRAVAKVADAVLEMHEAQRRVMVMRTAVDRYVENPHAAPSTYDEFVVRTSGMLLHEPPARKRIRAARGPFGARQ